MAKVPFLLQKNRVYRISNTPGTKIMKFGMKCFILHFKMEKTIKFECIFFSLETFLESLQQINVKQYLFEMLLLHNKITLTIIEFWMPT